MQAFIIPCGGEEKSYSTNQERKEHILGTSENQLKGCNALNYERFDDNRKWEGIEGEVWVED